MKSLLLSVQLIDACNANLFI